MKISRFLVALLFVTVPVMVVNAAETSHPPGTAIASAHKLATDAGFEVIEKGGNAFDAAVAVSAALSVVEPISSGIGGGGFFLLFDAKSQRYVFVDARETSPKSATPEQYLNADGSMNSDRAENGPWSAGIPGLPAALVHVSKNYGRLPLSDTLAPAIRLAREGFPVYGRLARGYEQRREVMERYPGTKAVFTKNGVGIKEGDILKQPDLAKTLDLIAKKGRDGFYRGEVANKLIQGVNKAGGKWNAEELAAYQVAEREPLRFNYKNMDIITAPPPSSGGVAMQQIFNIISAWDLTQLDQANRTHVLVEAMRRAYRDRTIFMGDPDFVKIPLNRLLSLDYAAGLRAGIHPERATPSDLLSSVPAPLEDEETTHFSILDNEGNRVSTTQTVNLLYGSGLIPEGTGVLLNDEMDDFALKPGTPNAFGVMGSKANAPEPGKRMLSSMTPTIVETPEQVMVLGSPGGSRIITQVLIGILAYSEGLDAQAVAAYPRIHHQWHPDTIYAEFDALTPETITALQAMGHKVEAGGNTVLSRRNWGNLQTVMWNKPKNQLQGGTDPRNEVGGARVELDKSK